MRELEQPALDREPRLTALRLVLLTCASLMAPVIAFVQTLDNTKDRGVVNVGAILLFALGVVLGYLIIPYALQFLLSLTPGGIDASMLRLSDYVGFVLAIMLAFGLAFEFPILLLVGARLGILSYGFLSARRRWAILAIVLFAIIATPGGDPASSAVLSLVMYALFEGTLQIIRALRP
jgi:sec-independent protein translocase protein TatC